MDTFYLGTHFAQLKSLKIQTNGPIFVRNLSNLNALHIKTEQYMKSDILIDPTLPIRELKLYDVRIGNVSLFRTDSYVNNSIESLSLIYEPNGLTYIINAILNNPGLQNLKTIRLFVREWNLIQHFMNEIVFNVIDYYLLPTVSDKTLTIFLEIKTETQFRNKKQTILDHLKFIKNIKVKHYTSLTNHNYQKKSFIYIYMCLCVCVSMCLFVIRHTFANCVFRV